MLEDNLYQLKVVMYDRCNQGVKRLGKNVNVILAATNGSLRLSIKKVSRHKKFGSEPNMEELLYDHDFTYGALVINYAASHASEVLEDVELLIAAEELDPKRVILLYSNTMPSGLLGSGIHLFEAEAGNCHLGPNGAGEIADLLYLFAETDFNKAKKE